MSDIKMTQAERITALETRVYYLAEQQAEMNKKLDDLLTLRNKGAGIFWLASVLFGTSIIGFTTFVLSVFRSH